MTSPSPRGSPSPARSLPRLLVAWALAAGLAVSAPACRADEPRFQRAPAPVRVGPTRRDGCPAGDPALPGVERVDPSLVRALSGAATGAHRHTNRLALESSPYLRQHAHNPVNWFPWGAEALCRAREGDRLILLSVGYSTCHWCHVMERESFEDEEIARQINADFVAIKVDRESRPDLDEIYMQAVVAMSGHGGWPMTLVLTPDLQPVFAATYLPPRAGVRGARSGLVEVLAELRRRHRTDREGLLREAEQVGARLALDAEPMPPGDVPGPDLVAAGAGALARGFDADEGGFGRAPKFPQPSRLLLMLEHHRASGDARALAMVTATLDAMARGGIHDVLGGGFHRYATDRAWNVPHFEKMLYDNALLAVALVETFLATGEERFAGLARETLDYLLRDMRHEGGAFFAATDADSPLGTESVEGAYFTWTPPELDAVLAPERAALARQAFDVRADGAVEGRSVLRVVVTPGALAAERGTALPALEGELAEVRATLLAARGRRPPPARDEKILVAWNALAISALARAGFALSEPRYATAAERALEFLDRELRSADGALLHEWVAGSARTPAFLDDHAALALAHLDVFEASGRAEHLARAVELEAHMTRAFREPSGIYRMSSAAHDAARRPIAIDDGAVPAGTSLAALALLRLSLLTGDDATLERADALLAALSPALRRAPPADPPPRLGVSLRHARAREIAIVGEPGRAALLDVLRRSRVPHVRVLGAAGARDELLRRVPWLAGKVPLDGRATAYVCERGRCELPTSDPRELARQLEGPARAAGALDRGAPGPAR
jgi:uncharacterized protein YyaL (SSP411 family)